MSHDKDRATTDRRSFLKLAGVTTVTGGAALAASGDSVAAEAPKSPTAAGYRETDHVRKVYDTARF